MGLAAGTMLLNRYEIQAMLGQGGMGAVYRAHDHSLGRNVAVKERAPDPNGTEQGMLQARLQFRREAQTLAQLAHPHLPHIYDYFSDSDHEYIVMDLIEGENLHRRVQEHGSQNEQLVLSWTRQILEALVYLHARNAIHRDIKPQNMILANDDRVVLVDFGLVKLLDPEHPSTLTLLRGVGTPEYAPLEQYSREIGHTDPRSDIFSLGATLYTLLTGKTPADVHVRLLNPGAWKPIRDVNPAISFGTASIVEKAMGLYPQQRYQTALDMLQAFGFPPARFAEKPNAQSVSLVAPVMGRDLEKEFAPAHNASSGNPTWSSFELSPITQTVAPQVPKSANTTQALHGRIEMPKVKPKVALTLVKGVLRMQIGLGKFIEFVRVPAGRFLMGSDPRDDPHLHSDETPQRTVELKEYWISKFPITVAQYTLFTSAMDQPTPFDFPQKSEFPITNVSWYDATVFCRWASDLGEKQVRLPTEAEWEKAARGTDGRVYPWGDEFDSTRLNCADGKINNTTPVDKYPNGSSPCGAFDMAGNVWEWTYDWYKPDYYHNLPTLDPQGADTGSYKSLRGGAWFSDSVHVRAADRTHFNPDNRYDYVGFRVVLESGV